MSRPAEELPLDGAALRRWRADDAAALYRAVLESIDHLRPWMPWVADGYVERDAVEYVERCDSLWADGKEYNYAILAEDGTVIGSCGLMSRVGPGALEIGYWLHPGHTGAGIVTKAVAALTGEALRIGAERVVVVHDQANVRSGAIPARLGFVEVQRRPREPVTPGDTGTEVVWQFSG